MLIVGSRAYNYRDFRVRNFYFKKNKLIKNFTSKTPTLIFVIILTIFAFFFTYANTKDIAYSVGGAFGYVYIWSTLCALFGVLAMNKFKFNKKEFWNSWFFSLIWIFNFDYSRNT